MKIAILNSSDAPGGGSSAVRLHRALRKAGQNSKLGLWFQADEEEGVECLADRDRIGKAFRLGGNVLDSFQSVALNPRGKFSSDFISAPTKRLLSFVNDADIILLGMASHFVNSKQIRKMAKATKARIVWMLNDHAAFTGGCHYTYGCERFASGCGICPAIQSRNRFDISAWTWRRKNHNLSGLKLGVVACSSSDEALVRKSPWFKRSPIALIPLPIDSDQFKPIPKEVARVALGIREEGKIVFFGATYLKDERKGLRHAIEAMTIVSNRYPELLKDFTFIIAGKGYSEMMKPAGFNIKHLGVLQDERALALAYQASDILLSPSLMDSGPMMVLESLMCGTPVVAFPIGYAADVVPKYGTGIIAQHGNTQEFAEGIIKLAMMPMAEMAKMRQRSRQAGLDYCSSAVVAAKHIEFYEGLLRGEN